MAHLASLLDPTRLRSLIADGFITCRAHPTEPLVVYDYTSRASATGTWTAETRHCRGLIAHRDGAVVARPFAKFFNLAEHDLRPDLTPLPSDAPFEVLEKMDGSLGILYPTSDGLAIATRGSFTSGQAAWATAHWRERYGDLRPPAGTTWLFEIIYPANRIVVDYAGFEGLVLLAAIDCDTGADVALPPDWPGPVVRRHDASDSPDRPDPLDSLRQLAATAESNREGFVVRFAAPAGRPSLRVKLKFAEYLRLHQLVTGVSTRTVWERLAAGRGLDDLVDRAPAEFVDWVRATAGDLQQRYAELEAECRAALADARVDRADRRATAAYFAESGANAAVLFKMLDGRSYDEIIWRALRPSYRRPFRVDTQP